MSDGSVAIKPVKTSSERKEFIRLASAIYADDENYVAPLEFEIGPRLDPEKNPGLRGSPNQLWVAHKNGVPVGRIAAIVNQGHINHYNDGAGHFGFFESIDDAEVATALLQTAAEWLRQQGMVKIAGPFNFSVNEECGLLIDGFDTPPYVMMPHGRRYYQRLIEADGFTKAMDMYALRYIPKRQFIPEKRLRFVEKALSNPKVSIRSLDASDLLGDIKIIIDIYSDAWSDNWGFIPFTEDHAKHMASELRPIISKYNVVLCYYDGEPAAFGLVLPNINEITHDFDGKLLPFNWAKFLWRLKVRGVTKARMPLMGVRKRLQGKPVGAAFAYKIIDMVNSANMDHGVTESELSWILETNPAMLTMLTDIGAKIYKTYRIYEKTL